MTKKKVALLLDQTDNLYQKLLAQEATRSAAMHEYELVGPLYGGGSSVAQMESLLKHTTGEERVDGVMLVSAGSGSQLPASRRAAKAGLSLVYLNRIPPYLDELRAAFPDVLIAAVAPDQTEVGRIQAAQARKLLPNGGFVLLITGTPSNPSAIARKDGLIESAGASLTIHVLDGLWTEESALKALADWFHLGADRERAIGLVVCQNDQMGRGARRALVQQAAVSGKSDVAKIPIVGCDGLAGEGQAMVQRGDLKATVVVPPTTPRAVDILADFWERGTRSELALLQSESFPPVDRLVP